MKIINYKLYQIHMIWYYIRAVSKRRRWLQYLKNQMYFSNWYVLLNLLVDKNVSSYVIADAYNDGYIKFFVITRKLWVHISETYEQIHVSMTNACGLKCIHKWMVYVKKVKSVYTLKYTINAPLPFSKVHFCY